MLDLHSVHVPLLPPAAVYAGLFGCLAALLVAWYQQNWSLKVLFLLALRLAVGWHFAFEGLHKFHSHFVGPTETSKPFTSEPYFAVAEGPFGDFMRKRFLGDPASAIAAKLTPPDDTPRAKFAVLPEAEQAGRCPKPVAEALDAGIPDAKKAAEAKAAFARWVYGAALRDAKAKFVGSGDVAQGAPDRLAQIAVMKKWAKELHDREALGLGVGYGVEVKRAAAARADVRAAETDLAADADAYVADLVKLLGPKPDPDAPKSTKAEKAIAGMDRLTMWTLTVAGLCVLFGLFTPVACLVCAGFLVLTYLTHPPLPWYPLPPGTEGNPLFVNKNVVECLALLVIAVHPTGRWLGLDAIWTRVVFGK